MKYIACYAYITLYTRYVLYKCDNYMKCIRFSKNIWKTIIFCDSI